MIDPLLLLVSLWGLNAHADYPVQELGAVSPLVATAAPRAQLNLEGFAACLAKEAFYQGARLSLRELRTRESLGALDLFLPYLAIYPGKQLPLWPLAFQRRAQARWSYAWDAPSRELAERMVVAPGRTPADWFRAALGVCRADVFCAVLVTHNVLRTLGRHEQGWFEGHDYNAPWFAARTAYWQAEIPALQNALISLRPDGGGDRWGEWYHFFGVVSFVLHETSVRGSLLGVREIVQLNDRFNEWLVGSPEGAEKARLDLDAIETARIFVASLVSASPTPVVNCDDVSAYTFL